MKRKNKRKVKYGITASIIFLFLFSVSLFSVVNVWKEKKPKKIPYYEEKVFNRPDFLPTPATLSAEITPLKIPIVMYHYIEYVVDSNDVIRKRLDTTPYQFEKHLKDLKEHNYETYFVKDISDILNGNVLYNSKSVVLTFDDGYEDFYTYAFPLLKKYHMRGTVYIITNKIGRKGFLSQKEIEELIRSGLIEIGSHTKDHTYLKKESLKMAKKQIFESKETLEQMFDIQVESFAYPYGAMSRQILQLVKEAGYRDAVSVIAGTVQSSENLFFLSRIRPEMFGGSIVQSIEEMKK